MQCALGYHPHSKTPPLSFLPSPLKFPKCPSPFFSKNWSACLPEVVIFREFETET